MRFWRGALSLLGVAIAGVGLFAAATSVDLLGSTINGVAQQLGNDYLLIAVIGAATLALVLLFVLLRVTLGIDQIAPPEPEGVPTGPRPGAELDRYLTGRFGVRSHVLSDEPERIRRRLREDAIQTVMVQTDASREEARRQVENGTWTPDAEAAAYLAGPAGPDVPFASRVKGALAGRSWRQRGARRAAKGIVTLADGDS